VTRVLVTGAASFTARYLLPELLASAGADVFATDLVAISTSGVNGACVNVTDRVAVRDLVADVRPDLVYHLAGAHGTDAERCYAVNFEGARNLLDACGEAVPGCRVLLVSSAAVYGLTRPEASPVNEHVPLRPVTRRHRSPSSGSGIWNSSALKKFVTFWIYRTPMYASCCIEPD
jgi:GDP-4-dehydro-6-deoxy-D-mannose reductase